MEAHWWQLSDKELVSLIVSGNREAFAVICRKYERRLYKTAARITRNETDAEDIVQEAFFKAYQGIARFKFASSLSTWLTQIVINFALMELRRRKSRPCLPLDDANECGVPLADLIQDSTIDIEEAVVLKEQSRLLTAGIARLPPNLRIVMNTYRTSDLTIAELAGAHAITISAAKSRLMRAKAMVKTFRQVANPPRRTP
jgi:RNA polymerase sigma-70 factor (ECF subfamily)